MQIVASRRNLNKYIWNISFYSSYITDIYAVHLRIVFCCIGAVNEQVIEDKIYLLRIFIRTIVGKIKKKVKKEEQVNLRLQNRKNLMNDK